MQSKKTVFIQLVIILLIFYAFYLPWVSKGFISVSGFKLPSTSESMTKISNIRYILTPSKKEITTMAYALYLIPILGGISFVSLLKRKSNLSLHLLLLTSIVGLFLVSNFFFTMNFSSIGWGAILLFATCISYIILFCTPSFRRKDKKEDSTNPDLKPKEDSLE